MKQIFVMMAMIFIAVTVNAQRGWDEYCTVPKFRYMAITGHPHGGGFEVGAWPQEDLLGYAGGLGYYQQDIQKSKSDNPVTKVSFDIFGKVLLRVNRYLYVTGSGGLTTMINGYSNTEQVTHLYWNTSARGVLPLGDGSTFCLLLEPSYGYHGFVIQGGLGIAF